MGPPLAVVGPPLAGIARRSYIGEVLPNDNLARVIMQRRDFLFAFAALPLFISARRVPGAASVIGVVYGAGTRGGRTTRGLQFGISEAKRTSELLGREIEWIERAGTQGVQSLIRARAELIIALGDVGPIPASSPPILRLPADGQPAGDCGPNEWSIAPAPEQKNAVLREYRSSHTSAPRDLRVLAWHQSLEKFGAAQLNQRYRVATGEGMGENAWLGWFAAKVALESVLRGNAAAELKRTGFAVDGHKGVGLGFDPQRRLQQPLYVAGDSNVLAEITPPSTPAACAIPASPPPH